jgi:hypothetical protein
VSPIDARIDLRSSLSLLHRPGTGGDFQLLLFFRLFYSAFLFALLTAPAGYSLCLDNYPKAVWEIMRYEIMLNAPER